MNYKTITDYPSLVHLSAGFLTLMPISECVMILKFHI